MMLIQVVTEFEELTRRLSGFDRPLRRPLVHESRQKFCFSLKNTRKQKYLACLWHRRALSALGVYVCLWLCLCVCVCVCVFPLYFLYHLPEAGYNFHPSVWTQHVNAFRSMNFQLDSDACPRGYNPDQKVCTKVNYMSKRSSVTIPSVSIGQCLPLPQKFLLEKQPLFSLYWKCLQCFRNCLTNTSLYSGSNISLLATFEFVFSSAVDYLGS